MIIKSFDMSVDYAELSSNQPNETAKLTSYMEQTPGYYCMRRRRIPLKVKQRGGDDCA